MSTSQKMKDFTSEPMGEKPVTSLAGIGEKLGGKLYDEVSKFFKTLKEYYYVTIN